MWLFRFTDFTKKSMEHSHDYGHIAMALIVSCK